MKSTLIFSGLALIALAFAILIPLVSYFNNFNRTTHFNPELSERAKKYYESQSQNRDLDWENYDLKPPRVYANLEKDAKTACFFANLPFAVYNPKTVSRSDGCSYTATIPSPRAAITINRITTPKHGLEEDPDIVMRLQNTEKYLLQAVEYPEVQKSYTFVSPGQIIAFLQDQDQQWIISLHGFQPLDAAEYSQVAIAQIWQQLHSHDTAPTLPETTSP